MFGKMGEMMGQLRQMKAAADEVKEKLNEVELAGESRCGRVYLKINGNQEIRELRIDSARFDDPEEMNRVVMATLNKGISASKKRMEKEMQASAKNILPNLPAS